MLQPRSRDVHLLNPERTPESLKNSQFVRALWLTKVADNTAKNVC